MSVHYASDLVTVMHGDCLDELRSLPDASVHAVVTDPPYGIAFMGKAWDQPGEFGSQRKPANGPNNRRGKADAALNAGLYDLSPTAMRNFQRWVEAWATECLRVLKPGGHLLAFGGSRTWHRLAGGIEDAGFEIRDTMAWLYGSGFPKSLDVAKAIDAHLHGTAEVSPRDEWEGWGTALKPSYEPIVLARKRFTGTVAANVIEHGAGALNLAANRVGDEARVNPAAANKPGGAAYMMSAAGMPADAEAREAIGRWAPNVLLDGDQADSLDRAVRDEIAERYFPVFRWQPKAASSERPVVDGIAHPTVKPIALMQWLVRLVTPAGGTVLEPFAGSGTTLEACIREGFNVIGIEREADYLPLIMSRIRKDHAQSLFDDLLGGDAA